MSQNTKETIFAAVRRMGDATWRWSLLTTDNLCSFLVSVLPFAVQWWPVSGSIMGNSDEMIRIGRWCQPSRQRHRKDTHSQQQPSLKYCLRGHGGSSSYNSQIGSRPKEGAQAIKIMSIWSAGEWNANDKNDRGRILLHEFVILLEASNKP